MFFEEMSLINFLQNDLDRVVTSYNKPCGNFI